MPPGSGNDGSLPSGVVHRLLLVVLAIELDEQADLGPRQIYTSNERPVPVGHDQLPGGIAESGHVPGQLDHERLQEALGGGGARRTPGEDAPDTSCARCACAAELRHQRIDRFDRRQAHAHGGLERLLPHGVVRQGGKIDEGLQPIGAPDAMNDMQPVPDLSPSPHRHPVKGDPVQPVEHAGQGPAGEAAQGEDSPSCSINGAGILRTLGVDAARDTTDSGNRGRAS